jgi:hypothetical protein
MLKHGGEEMLTSLTLLLNLIWSLETPSTDWKLTPVCPVYKKGSFFDPKNYRPIALLSNLFKLLERVVDVRIRSVYVIIIEQCGFRPHFGTEMQLLRLSVLMQYCKSVGKGLWMAFLDLEEAFERAWRPGILYRLWLGGIKGKCWRIVRVMLTETWAYVRTNFGDTVKFLVQDGVLQGSVLAAILFIIFINPLVEALMPYCPLVNSLRIGAQLFADDLLLLGTHPSMRHKLVSLTLIWAEKWRAKVKDIKSSFLTTNGTDSHSTNIGISTFVEVAKVFHLGLGIDRNGVFSIGHVFAKVEKAIRRLHTLTRSGIKLGGVRADACADVYRSAAMSVLTYALALCPPESNRVAQLNASQAVFANKFLGLPKDTPGYIAMAELGFTDMQLVAARARVLLLCRVMKNREDDLTRALVSWPLDSEGSTFLSQSEEALRILGYKGPLATLIRAPYKHVAYCLKQVTITAQQGRWEKVAARLRGGSYVLSKVSWGFEAALVECPPDQAMCLVKLRAGLISCPQLTIAGQVNAVCALCHSPHPSTSHMVGECMATSAPRRTLAATLMSTCPHLSHVLAQSSCEESTNIILGGFVTVVPGFFQPCVRRACVLYASEVATIATHA